MLTAMRDGAHSKIIQGILFSLLLFAALGMALMDVGGFFRNGGVGNNVVVKIGNEKINAQQFDAAMQPTLREMGLNAKDAYQKGMVDGFLQNEISDRILTQGGIKMGLEVSDEAVTRQINRLVEPLAKAHPEMSKRDVVLAVLNNKGMSEASFVADVRRSLMNTLQQNTIESASIVPSRQEAIDLYRIANETRSVQGFILANSSVKDLPAASDDTLKGLYEAAKDAKYAKPETRSFTVAILSEDAVKASIVIPDADIRAEYDKSPASYTLPDRRAVQQAILSTQADADKVATAVKGGASLKDAVKTVTGKDSAYTGEQETARAGLQKNISDAVFAAPLNQPTAPVKTTLGYHVFVSTKEIPGGERPFDSVKADIRRDLIQAKLSQQMQTAANTIDDRLAGGETLDKIAKDTNMKVTKIGPVMQDGTTPDKHDGMKDFAKDRDYLLQSAFQVNQGESAPVLELSDGRYAAVHVDAVTPKSYKPFAEVRDDLRKDWLADQQASANRTRAQDIQQKIAAGQKTVEQAAAGFNVKPQMFTDLKRIGDAPKEIGKTGIAALFESAQGEAVLAPVPDGYLIGVVKTVQLPDASKIADKDLKATMDAQAKNARGEYMDAYSKYLQGKLGVKINRRLLDQTYGGGKDEGS